MEFCFWWIWVRWSILAIGAEGVHKMHAMMGQLGGLLNRVVTYFAAWEGVSLIVCYDILFSLDGTRRIEEVVEICGPIGIQLFGRFWTPKRRSGQLSERRLSPEIHLRHIPASTMRSLIQLLLLLVGFSFTASAQFQFFENMFGGGGQQQQQPQNVASDSNWYRQNYDAGIFPSFLCFDCIYTK